jgi:hypothetical protein
VDDRLKPDEHDLVGQWLDLGSRIVGDAVSARIRWLVSSHLERVAALPDDSATLFRDPGDGRFWELTTPHVNGPPRLTNVTPESAATRYELDRLR